MQEKDKCETAFTFKPVVMRDAICIISPDNSPPVLHQFVRAQRHLVAGRSRGDASGVAHRILYMCHMLGQRP